MSGREKAARRPIADGRRAATSRRWLGRAGQFVVHDRCGVDPAGRGAREERIAEFPTTVVIIFVNRAGSPSCETVRAG